MNTLLGYVIAAQFSIKKSVCDTKIPHATQYFKADDWLKMSYGWSRYCNRFWLSWGSSRPHPLHGWGIITPFRILNAWEAQYCPFAGFLHKLASPTNNQLQGIFDS